jgi:hypothetical protein
LVSPPDPFQGFSEELVLESVVESVEGSESAVLLPAVVEEFVEESESSGESAALLPVVVEGLVAVQTEESSGEFAVGLVERPMVMRQILESGLKPKELGS